MVMNLLILIAGLALYALTGWAGLVYLVAATVLSYGIGLLIPKKKWLMWVGVMANAGILLYIKLLPITNWSFIGVLGISYFSLQIIAYLVDVYKEKHPPERNFLRYALFITYFPHLEMGPIERYDRFMTALQNRKITWNGALNGAARMAWGGMKLLLIDARVSVAIAAVVSGGLNGVYALAAMVLYSLRLYTNFSGYIDLVLGGSKMLGLQLSENFDSPYLSQSFQEFWRRWHITLGDWLKNYVYIPLGGNRKGKLRKTVNQILTFLVSGIWHGIHYLLWGIINGIFVACGTKFQTKWKHLNRVCTFLLVSVLWSFFVWPDTLSALQNIGSVFTVFNYGQFDYALLGLTVTDWIVVAVASAALWCYDVYKAKLNPLFEKMPAWSKVAVIGGLGILVLVFGRYGLGFNAAGFVYGGY